MSNIEQTPVWHWKLYLEDVSSMNINSIDFKEPEDISSYTKDNPKVLYTALVRRDTTTSAPSIAFKYHVDGSTTVKTSGYVDGPRGCKYYDCVVYAENNAGYFGIRGFNENQEFVSMTTKMLPASVFNPSTNLLSMSTLYISLLTSDVDVYRYVYEVPEVDPDAENYLFTNAYDTCTKKTPEGHFLVENLTDYSSLIPNVRDEYDFPFYAKASLPNNSTSYQLRYSYGSGENETDATISQLMKAHTYIFIKLRHHSSGAIQTVAYAYNDNKELVDTITITTKATVGSSLKIHGFYSSATSMKNYRYKPKVIYKIRNEFATRVNYVKDYSNKFNTVAKTQIIMNSDFTTSVETKKSVRDKFATKAKTVKPHKNAFNTLTLTCIEAYMKHNTTVKTKKDIAEKFNTTAKTKLPYKTAFSTTSKVKCEAENRFNTAIKTVKSVKDKFNVLSKIGIKVKGSYSTSVKTVKKVLNTHNTVTFTSSKARFVANTSVKTLTPVRNTHNVAVETVCEAKNSFNTDAKIKCVSKKAFNTVTNVIHSIESKLSFNAVAITSYIAENKAITKVDVKKDVKSVHTTMFRPLISVVNKFSTKVRVRTKAKSKHTVKDEVKFDSLEKYNTTASIINNSKIAFNTVTKVKPKFKTAYNTTASVKSIYTTKHNTNAKVVVKVKNSFNTETTTYMHMARSFNVVCSIDFLDTIKMLLGLTDKSKDPILKYLVLKAIDDMHLYCNMTENELVKSKSNLPLSTGYFPSDSMLGENRQLQTILIDLVIYYYQMRGMEHLKSESVEGASWSYISDEIPKQIQVRLKPYKKLRALRVL